MTVQSLIDRALRKLGVLASGEAADAQMTSDGIEVLNDILSQWSSQRWCIHEVTTIELSLTSGTEEYTLGTGGDHATRPVKILSAYLRKDGYDYPLKKLSRQAYDQIGDKDSSGIPNSYYYEPSYPQGVLSVYPSPDSNDTIHLKCWTDLTEYSSATDVISLPNIYRSALVYNLARDYASEFSMKIPENVALRSVETLKQIKKLNVPVIPQIRTGRSKGGYDITTDTYHG